MRKNTNCYILWVPQKVWHHSYAEKGDSTHNTSLEQTAYGAMRIDHKKKGVSHEDKLREYYAVSS